VEKLFFHCSFNVWEAFRNCGAEHGKSAGVKRSKALAYCCCELSAPCKDRLLLLDANTVTPIFTLEMPFVFAGDVLGWASAPTAPGVCCLFFLAGVETDMLH